MGLKEELKKDHLRERHPYGEAIYPTIAGTLEQLVKHPGESLLKGAEYMFEWPGAFVRGAWTADEDDPLSLLAEGAKTVGRHFAGMETPTGQEAIKSQFGKGIGEDTWWGPIASQVLTNPLDVATIPLLPKDIYMAARHAPGAIAKLRHPIKLAQKAAKAAPKVLEEALPTVMKPLRKFKSNRELARYIDTLGDMRKDVSILVKERDKLRTAKSGPRHEEILWGIEKGERPRIPEAIPKEMSKAKWKEFLDKAMKGKLDQKELSSLINIGTDNNLYLRPPAGGEDLMYVALNRLLPKKYGRYLVALNPDRNLYDYYRLTDDGIGIILPKAGRKWWGTRTLPDGREVADLPDWMKTVLDRANKDAISDLNIWIRDLKDPKIKDVFKSYPAHYHVPSKTISMAPAEALDSEVAANILFKAPTKLAEKHALSEWRQMLGKKPVKHAVSVSSRVRPGGKGLNLMPSEMKTISTHTRKGWEYFFAHEMGHHITDTSADLARKSQLGYHQIRHKKGDLLGSDAKAYDDYVKYNKKYKSIKPPKEGQLTKEQAAAKAKWLEKRNAIVPDEPTYYNNFRAMTENWPMFDWNIYAYRTPEEFMANAFAQMVGNDMYLSPEFLAGFPPHIRDALRRMLSRNWALRMPIKLGKHKLLHPIPKVAEKEFLTIGDMPKIKTEWLRKILPKPVAENLRLTEELLAGEFYPIVESVPPKVAKEVGDRLAKNLGKTFGVGLEEPRKLKAVAARNTKTGEIVKGKPGQIHGDLPHKVLKEPWDLGFVDDFDEYYTRYEAKVHFGAGESYDAGIAKPYVVDFEALVQDRLSALNMGDAEAVKRANYVILKDHGMDKLKEAMTSNIATRFKEAKKLIKKGALSDNEKKLALKRLAADLRQAKKNIKFDIKIAKLDAEMAEIKKPDWEPPIQ